MSNVELKEMDTATFGSPQGRLLSPLPQTEVRKGGLAHGLPPWVGGSLIAGQALGRSTQRQRGPCWQWCQLPNVGVRKPSR